MALIHFSWCCANRCRYAGGGDDLAAVVDADLFDLDSEQFLGLLGAAGGDDQVDDLDG
jgi:hypothetical protein